MRAVPLPGNILLPGPRLGLLSDSHGDTAMTHSAMNVLLARDADAVVHLGDICSRSVLGELAGVRRACGEEIPVYAVPGNMDGDPEELILEGRRLGIEIIHPAILFHFAAHTIFAHHGHISGLERAALSSGATTVLHGHTHRIRDEMIDGVRFINPGALHRASRYTIALLDLSSSVLDVMEISSGGDATESAL